MDDGTQYFNPIGNRTGAVLRKLELYKNMSSAADIWHALFKPVMPSTSCAVDINVANSVMKKLEIGTGFL